MELTQTENKSVVLAAVSNCVEVMADRISTYITSEREIISIIQALRSTNRNLLNRAMQLEQTVVEYKQQLQTQQERSQIAESHMQKTQELIAAQEQIKLLKQELAIAQQTAQQQQIINEGLSAQLQSSQEQVDQAQREWLLIQENYNQQALQMRQKEAERQELNNRLQREQQRNAQLKIALEKCHELSPTNEQLDASDRNSSFGDTEDNANQSWFLHTQPIRPWSASLESVEQPTSEWIPATPSPQASAQPSQNYIEVDDTLIATLVECPDEIAMEQTTEERDTLDVLQPIAVESHPTDAPQTQAIATPNIDGVNPESPAVEEAAQWEDDAEFFIPNPNWPSPVINPSRNVKKRRLATIELPKFTHV